MFRCNHHDRKVAVPADLDANKRSAIIRCEKVSVKSCVVNPRVNLGVARSDECNTLSVHTNATVKISALRKKINVGIILTNSDYNEQRQSGDATN